VQAQTGTHQTVYTQVCKFKDFAKQQTMPAGTSSNLHSLIVSLKMVIQSVHYLYTLINLCEL